MKSNITSNKKSSIWSDNEEVLSIDHNYNETQGNININTDIQTPQVVESLTREILIIVLCTIASSIYGLSTGSFQIAIKHISDFFNVSGGPLTWIVTGLSIADASFVLLNGKVCDTFGRKRCLIISLIAYTILCIAGGFATNFIALNILRALQGVAISATVPACGGILGSSYPPGKKQNIALSFFSASLPIGIVLGYVLGGICVQISNWRAIMYFLAILSFLVAVGCYYIIPNDSEEITWKISKRKIKEMDFIGALIAITGIILFVFALTQEGTEIKGWKTPYIIILLIIGFGLIIGFCFYEQYFPKYPLIPMFVWKNKSFSICMLITFLNFAIYDGTLAYYQTLYFEEIRGASPIMTTAYICPLCIAGVICNIIVASTLHLIPGKLMIFTGCICFIGASCLWAFAPIDIIYWAMPFPATILLAIGGDVCYAVVNVVAITSVPVHLQSTVTGILNTVGQLGISLGLAISSAIVSAIYPEYSSIEVGIIDKNHLFKAFKGAFYFAIGCSVVCTVLSLFLHVGKQDGKLETPEEKV